MHHKNNISDLLGNFDRIISGIPGSMGRNAGRQLNDLRRLILSSRPPGLLVPETGVQSGRDIIKSLFAPTAQTMSRSLCFTMGDTGWESLATPLGPVDFLCTGDVSGSDLEYRLKAGHPDCLIGLINLDQSAQELTLQIKGLKKLQDAVLEAGTDAPTLVLAQKEGSIFKGGTGFFTHSREYEKLTGFLHESGLDCIQTEIVSGDFFKSPLVNSEADTRAREKILVEMANVLPHSARLQFARLSRNRDVQKQVAENIIRPMAMVCGAIALNPLPVADIMPMTSAQLAMVSAVGCIAGREMSRKTALEFMSAAGINIGGAFAMREASRILCKIMAPVVGGAASAGVAYAGTLAVGKAAVTYFIDQSSGADIQDILRRFRKKGL